MTHEFRDLMLAAQTWTEQGVPMVMASLVHLEGSSYRKPGVRMLISEHGDMLGAVSGGCVEKEILRQAAAVFETGLPRMMTYDGRYRLGCEGQLYLLLEPLRPESGLIERVLQAIAARQPFSVCSRYRLELDASAALGSTVTIGEEMFRMNQSHRPQADDAIFQQTFPPAFQLYLFGAEHDAVQLCQLAAQLGWQVHIVANPDEQKTIEYFPGATRLHTPLIPEVADLPIDGQTAIVLMTHSLSKDVQYLLALGDCRPAYFGLLGPAHRREKLIEQLLEHAPELDYAYVEQLRGPTGLDIGANSAAEIAVSIMAEILAVVNDRHPLPLLAKKGRIHD